LETVNSVNLFDWLVIVIYFVFIWNCLLFLETSRKRHNSIFSFRAQFTLVAGRNGYGGDNFCRRYSSRNYRISRS